ncbi:hypothetical protein SEA_GRETCHEN_38 [Microbacterium phage Gretchen]|uniref:Uncharacterized protein n=1 Tax=Microbacterium phage Percival TaxID=2201439 RepID=A0A2Z4Q6L2_9CAUD|nr:hypothetical protein PBI_PERCIVAL_38 [Microbacterium phage Percival]UDL14812.1 hypothetical protein SEA_GRETCHEN_38 [Microbacterium phage Gretchen]
MATPKINPFQRTILVALNRLDKHIYAGLETPADRAARRRSDRLQAALAIPGQTRKARRAVKYATKSIERAAYRRAIKEASA